jgi:hypothetical protein
MANHPKLSAGNYLVIGMNYSRFMVPATAKTIEAFNLLVGSSETVFFDTGWDDKGEYYTVEERNRVSCSVVNSKEICFRDRIVKNDENESN